LELDLADEAALDAELEAERATEDAWAAVRNRHTLILGLRISFHEPLHPCNVTTSHALLVQMGGMGGGVGESSGRPTTSRAVPNPSPEKFLDYVVPSPTKEAADGTVVASVRGQCHAEARPLP